MKTNCYLAINENGSVKLTKNYPYLNVGQVAMQVNIEIPDKMFQSPRLQATLKVPEKATLPEQISVEVIDNLEEQIKSVTGLEMRVNVVKEEGGEIE